MKNQLFHVLSVESSLPNISSSVCKAVLSVIAGVMCAGVRDQGSAVDCAIDTKHMSRFDFGKNHDYARKQAAVQNCSY